MSPSLLALIFKHVSHFSNRERLWSPRISCQNSHSRFFIRVSHPCSATVGVTCLGSGARLSEFKALGYHILAIWAWACHISHPGLLLCFYKMGVTRGRTFVAGILKLHGTDIWGQICLYCGDALCIVGCLAAFLTYAHQLPVAPANPYHFVTTKYVSSQTSLNVPREQNQSWLQTLPYRAVLKREFLHL